MLTRTSSPNRLSRGGALSVALAGVIGAWIWASSHAHAQGQPRNSAHDSAARSTAVVALGGDASVGARVRARAIVAAGRVIERLDFVRRPITREMAACTQDACLAERAQRESLAFVTVVTLFSEGGGSEPTSVTVSFVEPDGQSYSAGAPIVDGDIDTAANVAVTAARDKWMRGPGTLLEVRGDPEQAVVIVDGVAVGTLPYSGRIAAGQHNLVVRLDGYVPHERVIELPAERNHAQVVEVHLQPGGEAQSEESGADETEGRVERSGEAGLEGNSSSARVAGRDSFSTWGPIALGTMGIAGITVATVGLLTADCQIGSALDCEEGDRVNAPSLAVYGGLGLVAVAGAVVWFLVDDSSAPDSAKAPGVHVEWDVSPGGVQLRGEF